MKRFIYNMLILLVYIPFFILFPLMIIAYVIAYATTQSIGEDVDLYEWVSKFIEVLSDMTNKLR